MKEQMSNENQHDQDLPELIKTFFQIMFRLISKLTTKQMIILIALTLFYFKFNTCFCQDVSVKQLRLDAKKLTLMQNELNQMQSGYVSINSALDSLIQVTKSNYDLQKNYFDHLLVVSPGIEKYDKLTQLSNYFEKIPAALQNALNYFQSTDLFTTKEIAYYSAITQNRQNYLQDLKKRLSFFTQNGYLMTDEQRMQGIDKIYKAFFDQVKMIQNSLDNWYLILQSRMTSKQTNEQLKSYFGWHGP